MKEDLRKALYLEYFTVGYNVAEGAASILAGYLAGSIALIGFGFDSAVESVSGCILIWRLKKKAISREEAERTEKKATRLIGISFFILGAYVLWESLKKLYLHEHPEPTLAGIIIAALSLIIMPLLSRSKYKTAEKIESRALKADSMQTFTCALLSIALLAGLGLNYLFGIWWADPVSALLIVVFILWEGFEGLHEGFDA